MPAIVCDKLDVKSFVTSYRWSSDSVGNICLFLPQGKQGSMQSSLTVSRNYWDDRQRLHAPCTLYVLPIPVKPSIMSILSEGDTVRLLWNG